MMKITFLLLFLSIGCNLLYAKINNSIDSLKKYTYKELQEKFYNYNYDGKPERSKLIAQYYLSKAKKENNNSQMAEGYAFMYINEDKENALKYIDSMATVAKKLNENIYPTRIYLLKANVYFKFNNQKEALNNYILGLKYAKQNNNKRQIALAETNIAYLNSYIGKHYEAAKILRYYMDNADYLNENEIEKIRVNLIDAYIEINKLDSANTLINNGLIAFKNKDPYKYNQYIALSGCYNLKLKRYNSAINDLSRAKKYFFTSDDERNKNYTLLYLGESYKENHENIKAVQNFVQIDSLIQKSNYIFPELREVYTFLVDYYKEKKDKEKQLYYIERFLKIDQLLDSQFRDVSRELPRRYDKPKLLLEKETITNELKKNKIILIVSVAGLSIALLIFTLLYYKSKKIEKKHRKIAQELMQSVQENSKIKVNSKSKEDFSDKIIQQENIKDKTINIVSEDLVQTILKELETFEARELFLNKGITLSNVAKKIKTNSKYLSEVINVHKGKIFAAYINDLRIDYAINRLTTDKKFRSYKIPFIAEELGYNNEQAFTLAFKKRTGITLSTYLKEIEKNMQK
ncbi:helix-turn-helix domain-containing protein [Chryseobacterium lathyri]|uniref:helix-turn-helix domain-containing protein n=1 Tax=Chryseobacterium lathyri TaxID=395933 RepID=UPI00278AAC70|nr:helix-turn-helix domain-containing protein [Chryseobacterium lathyri]MDQ0065160.1 AraC-like DNA-binding protein [Chryseobacterium lathyri]